MHFPNSPVEWSMGPKCMKHIFNIHNFIFPGLVFTHCLPRYGHFTILCNNKYFHFRNGNPVKGLPIRDRHRSTDHRWTSGVYLLELHRAVLPVQSMRWWDFRWISRLRTWMGLSPNGFHNIFATNLGYLLHYDATLRSRRWFVNVATLFLLNRIWTILLL